MSNPINYGSLENEPPSYYQAIQANNNPPSYKESVRQILTRLTDQQILQRHFEPKCPLWCKDCEEIDREFRDPCDRIPYGITLCICCPCVVPYFCGKIIIQDAIIKNYRNNPPPDERM